MSAEAFLPADANRPLRVAAAAWLDALAERKRTLHIWAPVWLAFGIGVWFALPSEPAFGVYATSGLIASAALALHFVGGRRWQAPALAVLLCAAGFLVAGYRAHSVAGPVLPYRYYGPVEGRVVDIDRSYSDAVRLTLDRVALKEIPEQEIPYRVRVALHGDQSALTAQPGTRVRMMASIAPPGGPVAPGSFDFQRLAWFSQLGAVGYTRAPVEVVAPPRPSVPLWAFALRMRLSAAMQAEIPGQAGALSSAFMTGDRSAVTSETNDLMRASNLSHMISISGLHMGLLVGFVFALVRYGLALAPPLALRLPSKKIAAVIALLAATFYLALAGPDVATRRSYIMAAVMLLAVLAERRAVTLRTLAVAALIVLTMEPESLVEPGFQMSFGATAALIVAFRPWERVQDRVPRLLRPLAAMVLSSLAAGLATAPIAAAHFNRIADYGLIANLTAVPVMGVVVMPAGVIAAILAPFGLEAVPLRIMGAGTEVILIIARSVAGLDGAVRSVPSPPWSALPLLSTGALLAVLSSGWPRRCGALAVVLASALWLAEPRPALLISADAQAVGLMTAQGRALSKPKGAGFIVETWLQDDGDAADQPTAWLRPAFAGVRGRSEAVWRGRLLVHLTGRTAADRAAAFCSHGAMIVMTDYWAGPWTSAGCDVWDLRRLRSTGSVAFYPDGTGGYRVVTARDIAGQRMWNRQVRRTRHPLSASPRPARRPEPPADAIHVPRDQ